MQRPGGEAFTYGRRRAEVLSGQANGAVLLVLGLLVIYESIARLIHPPDVSGLAVTAVAAAGVVVNLVAAWVMAKAKRHEPRQRLGHQRADRCEDNRTDERRKQGG